MANRTGNYSAFYVNEPFDDSNLSNHATPDFLYFNQLRMWKGKDPSFPFIDSHNKTYNVRDNSDWEKTLKPRLHQRLSCSKNIILFLSSITSNSRALREEIDYGINTLGLPVIVIYPDYSSKEELLNSNFNRLSDNIVKLWDKLPMFRDNMNKVPTIHIPNKKDLIISALNDPDFKIQTKLLNGVYFY